MKFSLIMATLGRTDEVGRFLASLSSQTHRDYELFVVDQNHDDRLVPILERHSGLQSVRHLHSSEGLSKARNAALPVITGDIVGFPDDDCEFPPTLLEEVSGFLAAHREYAGVTGRPIDPLGGAVTRSHVEPGLLTRINVMERAISISMFFRTVVLRTVGGFDESLGAGAGTMWQAGEDTDYMLRVLAAGFRIYYQPKLVAWHPSPLRKGYHKAALRAYGYGIGIGRVWRKHRFPLWLVAYYFARPLGGAVLGLVGGDAGRARYYWNSFRGRLRGWQS